MAAATKTDGEPSPVKIGMIGGGVVGGGVYEILSARINADKKSTRPPIHITKLCVRDASKARDFKIDSSITAVFEDIEEILSDSSISVVVEVMGGTGIAKEAVMRALKAGKNVVTANKALIAECLDEIDTAVCHGSVTFGYEASVCGGIPIIKILQDCYAGDVIEEITGIMNGTTNYMLSKMESTGAAYSSVLKEAQNLGYAESDPTADVEGHDVRSKLAILCKLAFGATLPPSSIPTKGISSLQEVDFEYAKENNRTIKLLGTARRRSDGTLSVYVSPGLLPRSHPLASVNGCGNAVCVVSANLDQALYSGPGAGRFPTANSIVADICRVADGTAPSVPFGPNRSPMALDSDYSARFYARISAEGDLSDVAPAVAAAAARHGLSLIDLIEDKPSGNSLVFTTDGCRHSQIRDMLQDLKKENACCGGSVFIPIISD